MDEFKERIATAYEKSINASAELQELEQHIASLERVCSMAKANGKDVPDFVVESVDLLQAKVKSARSAHAFTQLHVQGVHWGIS